MAKSINIDKLDVTKLSDLKDELNNHLLLLQGKSIECNYADPTEAKFLDYLLKNFDNLNLQKLIIHYNNHLNLPYYLPNFHEDNYLKHNYKLEITRDDNEGIINTDI
jgi:hypothetical protein